MMWETHAHSHVCAHTHTHSQSVSLFLSQSLSLSLSLSACVSLKPICTNAAKAPKKLMELMKLKYGMPAAVWVGAGLADRNELHRKRFCTGAP